MIVQTRNFSPWTSLLTLGYPMASCVLFIITTGAHICNLLILSERLPTFGHTVHTFTTAKHKAEMDALKLQHKAEVERVALRVCVRV